MIYDVLIIGGGIVGTALLRELSRFDLTIGLLEAEPDIAMGTTKANTAIVHAGYDAVSGTRMAELNVRGHAMYPRLCRELDVPMQKTGSLVVAFSPEDRKMLEGLKSRGFRNGVRNLRIVEKDELHELEPDICPQAVSALYAPDAMIIGPWEMAAALAENAVMNGAGVFRRREVSGISYARGNYLLRSDNEEYRTRAVVNCAGTRAADVLALLRPPDYKIAFRKGQYFLFDKLTQARPRHVVFQVPGPLGKGVVCAPTVHGNVIVGPDAEDVSSASDLSTVSENLAWIRKRACAAFPGLNFKDVITEFSGIRAVPDTGDFIVREVPGCPGFFEAAGIKSPGLSAAPAIAEYLSKKIRYFLGDPAEKRNFRSGVPKRLRFTEMDDSLRRQMYESDPAWGHVVCRCETVTEAEIRDVIRRPCGARTVDGVKRRARPGSGRCQGGFCMPEVIRILAEELGVEPEMVEKEKAGSAILIRRGNGPSL